MKQRDVAFDIIKFVAIYMVIIGHVIQYLSTEGYTEDVFYQVIYSIHMPLFMTIAGNFAYRSIESNDYWKVIYKKFNQLIVPCITWWIILYAVSSIAKVISWHILEPVFGGG